MGCTGSRCHGRCYVLSQFPVHYIKSAIIVRSALVHNSISKVFHTELSAELEEYVTELSCLWKLFHISLLMITSC